MQRKMWLMHTCSDDSEDAQDGNTWLSFHPMIQSKYISPLGSKYREIFPNPNSKEIKTCFASVYTPDLLKGFPSVRGSGVVEPRIEASINKP